MAERIQVTAGAPWSATVDAGRLRVTCASFEPGFAIPSHFHGYGCLSVIVEGGFYQAFPRAEYECPPGGMLVKPPEERHIDRWGTLPSRHLIVEPKTLSDARDPAERVFHGISYSVDPRAAGLSRRIYEEIQLADELTSVSVEALALELIVLASRVERSGRADGLPPSWLRRAREHLSDAPPRALSIGAVARSAGVHPARLARHFRQYYGLSPGEYVRRLRVERARADLDTGTGAISAIALRHGYADQSHFTRDFKRSTGMTPAAYRRARGRH